MQWFNFCFFFWYLIVFIVCAWANLRLRFLSLRSFYGSYICVSFGFIISIKNFEYISRCFFLISIWNAVLPILCGCFLHFSHFSDNISLDWIESKCLNAAAIRESLDLKLIEILFVPDPMILEWLLLRTSLD